MSRRKQSLPSLLLIDLSASCPTVFHPVLGCSVPSLFLDLFPNSFARARLPCRAMGTSAIHVRCMDELTKDAVGQIEQIHSNWIDYEVAGEDTSLMALCADDIELWPPNAPPLPGHAAVSAEMAHRTTRAHSIEITDRRIRGSNEIAYLTACYKTTFSSAEDSTPRQALGSHLWILRKRAGTWVVTLVSWSSWGRGADAGTCQPPPFLTTAVISRENQIP